MTRFYYETVLTMNLAVYCSSSFIFLFYPPTWHKNIPLLTTADYQGPQSAYFIAEH